MTRWRREVRTNLWTLAERRTHLAERRPQLSPAETREFFALTWALRLFRHVYADIDFLQEMDLSFSHPGRILRPPTGPAP